MMAKKRSRPRHGSLAFIPRSKYKFNHVTSVNIYNLEENYERMYKKVGLMSCINENFNQGEDVEGKMFKVTIIKEIPHYVFGLKIQYTYFDKNKMIEWNSINKNLNKDDKFVFIKELLTTDKINYLFLKIILPKKNIEKLNILPEDDKFKSLNKMLYHKILDFKVSNVIFNKYLKELENKDYVEFIEKPFIGDLINVTGITKNHGKTGVVKRMNTSVRKGKHSRGSENRRHPGPLGPEGPSKVLSTIPREGQYGLFKRITRNLLVLDNKIEDDRIYNYIFKNYGVINKEDKFFIIKGDFPRNS